MYDVLSDACSPSPDITGARPPGIPAWLSRWVEKYLRACGVSDAAATCYVIGLVSADMPADPRSLVIRIHSALAAHGMHVTAPPALPALLPAEMPGAMPRHELSPVWSTSGASQAVPSRANVGMVCGGLVALISGILSHVS